MPKGKFILKNSSLESWSCFRLFLWRTQKIIYGYNFVAPLGHKAVMELFLSFKSFKSPKKVTESVFIGRASLSFHMMHTFPGKTFSLSVPNEPL